MAYSVCFMRSHLQVSMVLENITTGLSQQMMELTY